MPPSQPQSDQSAAVIEGEGGTALTSGDLSVAIALPCVTVLLLCALAGCIYMQRRGRNQKHLRNRAAALSHEESEFFPSDIHEASRGGGGGLALRQDSIPVQYMNASGKYQSRMLTSPVITSGIAKSCTTSDTTPAASIRRWLHKTEQLEFIEPSGLALPSTGVSPATPNTPTNQYGGHQKNILVSLKKNKILRQNSIGQCDSQGGDGAAPGPTPLRLPSEVLPPEVLPTDGDGDDTIVFNSTPAHNSAIEPSGLALPSTDVSPATPNTPTNQYGEHQKNILVALKKNKMLRKNSIGECDSQGGDGAAPGPTRLRLPSEVLPSEVLPTDGDGDDNFRI